MSPSGKRTPTQILEGNSALLVELHDQMSDQHNAARVADQQRTMILKELLEQRTRLETLSLIEHRLAALEPKVTKHHDFMMKIEGGLIITRLLWLGAGGLMVLAGKWLMDHWPSR